MAVVALRPSGVLIVMVLGMLGSSGCSHGSPARPLSAANARLHFEVSIPYRTKTFPDKKSFFTLAAADEAIAVAMESSGLGIWEGQSVGSGTYDIGLLGDDEKAVVKLVTDTLQKRHLATGTVIDISQQSHEGAVRRVQL